MRFLLIFAYFCLIETIELSGNDCIQRQTNPNDPTSMVCVCNVTHCHSIPPVQKIEDGYAYLYQTTASGLRLNQSKIKANRKNSEKTGFRLKILPSETFQEIIGFGGAMTDSVAINIDRFDDEKIEEILLNSYFGDEGLEYNVIRIPIASCDFSTREYSYLNTPNDFALSSFHLAEEDLWKIKFIRRAQKIARLPIKNFGSPWSAPAWMKTIGHMKGRGKLLPGKNYSTTYAQYFVRFIEDYTAQGVPIWGVTIQNEPGAGEDGKWGWQAMYFPPQDQSSFVTNFLGPAFKRSKTANETIIMIHDDQRSDIYSASNTALKDPVTNSYVSGIAVHWYGDRWASADELTKTKKSHPDKFILATEACVGDNHVGPELGNYSRGEWYAKDIIEDLQHDVSGWVDWNMVLDLQGGPNWVGNFVDSPVLANHTASEFYLQPMFYAMGHFSKFIKPGAKRVLVKVPQVKDFDSVAFRNPDGKIALVCQNRGDSLIRMSIEDERGHQFDLSLQPHSINTLIYI